MRVHPLHVVLVDVEGDDRQVQTQSRAQQFGSLWLE
jgi:hypothetical protein